MTFFHLTVPFTAYPSLSAYFIYLLVLAVFYPVVILQIIGRTTNYRFPLWAYGLFAFISLFIPNGEILNNLVEFAIMIVAMYFFAKPQRSLSQLIAMFCTGAFIYYTAAIIRFSLVNLVFGKQLFLPPYLQISTDLIPIINFLISLPIIHFYRPFYQHNLGFLAKRHVISGWFASILLFTTGFFMAIFAHEGSTTSPFFTLVIGLAIAALTTLIIKLVCKYYQNADDAVMAKYNFNNLVQYTSQLEVSIDDLRRFKHDYKNILYSLDSALNMNNTDYAKQVLHQLQDSTTSLINVPTNILSPLKNIKDNDVKSIVFNKFQKALDDHLQCQLEVEDEIKLTDTLQPIDAVRILAILLDNAIAAATQSKDKRLDLSLYENDFAQFIVVTNSTQQAEINLDQLDRLAQPALVGRGHHIGLRNLRIILANYPGASNNRSSHNHQFEQRIIIPKKVI